jgi:hypothetical protein
MGVPKLTSYECESWLLGTIGVACSTKPNIDAPCNVAVSLDRGDVNQDAERKLADPGPGLRAVVTSR